MRVRVPRIVVVTTAAVLAGGGVAVATANVVGGDGSIDGCYKAENGQLRVVTDGQGCLPSELPISWARTGPQGPPGPPGPQGEPGSAAEVRAYRTSRLTPDEVLVTAVGEGPIGFTFPPGAGPTRILTMTLPQGVYLVDSSVAARKDSGGGDLICWVHNNTVAHNVTRTALGADAGHARRATVASNGILAIPAGGGTLELECWQASNGAGAPSGEQPTVFYSALTAAKVARATLTRYPSGVTTELP